MHVKYDLILFKKTSLGLFACRWLRSRGLKIASERKMRKCAAEWLGSGTTKEIMPFTSSNKGDLEPKPIVYVPNLSQQITAHLYELNRYTLYIYIILHSAQ